MGASPHLLVAVPRVVLQAWLVGSSRRHQQQRGVACAMVLQEEAAGP